MRTRIRGVSRRVATLASAFLMVIGMAVATSSSSSAAPIATGEPTQVLVDSGPGWQIYATVPSGWTASTSPIPLSVINCGIITCSVYLSRAQTKSLQNNVNAYGGGLVGLAASCGLFALMTGPAAVYVTVACAALIGVYGGFMLNALSHAASSHYCLRVRYPIPLAFYSDNSGYCHNT
jgi:hypothetical protein